MKARDFLKLKLKEYYGINFGIKDERIIDDIVDAWMNDAGNSRHRFDDISRFLPFAKRILDMGSGCGTCVYYGLLNGYDMYGIDPEEWKYEFNAMKATEFCYTNEWMNRFYKGVGEDLPFSDNYFDCVTTYQTLEHVADPKKNIYEMLRVTKEGGGIHIRCPDYRSTFEGHYLLPWLPLFFRPFAKVYLRILHRSTLGLDTIKYVTKHSILNWINEASKAMGYELLIIDVEKVTFNNAMHKRNLPEIPGAFLLYKTLKFAAALFKREMDVNIFIVIQKKQKTYG